MGGIGHIENNTMWCQSYWRVIFPGLLWPGAGCLTRRAWSCCIVRTSQIRPLSDVVYKFSLSFQLPLDFSLLPTLWKRRIAFQTILPAHSASFIFISALGFYCRSEAVSHMTRFYFALRNNAQKIKAAQWKKKCVSSNVSIKCLKLGWISEIQ